jgi:hypothetical protein
VLAERLQATLVALDECLERGLVAASRHRDQLLVAAQLQQR